MDIGPRRWITDLKVLMELFGYAESTFFTNFVQVESMQSSIYNVPNGKVSNIIRFMGKNEVRLASRIYIHS